MKKFIYLLLISAFAMAQDIYYAQGSSGSSTFFIDGPSNSAGPITAISSFLNLAAFVKFVTLYAGVGIVLISFHKYFEYRKNSDYITFSYVMTLFVTGLALIGVYYIPFMVD